MPLGESSGQTINNAAEQRTADLARKRGEAAQALATELLSRHPDLVSRTLRTTIAGREFDAAFEAAEKARTAGHMNDNRSEKPGLTAYITQTTVQSLIEAASSADAEKLPYLADYIAQIQPVDQNGLVFSLRLPNGTFSMGFGGCQFYGDVANSGGQEVFNDPIAVGYQGVVRIEGDSGELWQNVNYTPDGTQRTT